MRIKIRGCFRFRYCLKSFGGTVREIQSLSL